MQIYTRSKRVLYHSCEPSCCSLWYQSSLDTHLLELPPKRLFTLHNWLSLVRSSVVLNHAGYNRGLQQLLNPDTLDHFHIIYLNMI